MVGMSSPQAPSPAVPVEITIKRDRTYPVVARPGPAWQWLYSYTTPVDVTWEDDRPGPRAGEFIEYGTHLASLRDRLRWKYGRNVRITETWKQPKSATWARENDRGI